jgi:hypothetical protein
MVVGMDLRLWKMEVVEIEMMAAEVVVQLDLN